LSTSRVERRCTADGSIYFIKAGSRMKHVTRWVALCLALGIPGSAVAQDYTKWYLAEGATGFFEEEILIGNPNAADAQVAIQYVLPAGSPVPVPAPKQVVVKGFSRATVRVNDDLPSSAVSAVVTCSNGLPIVVERSMYWGGAARLGGHNTTAVQQPAVEWFLAEGVSNAIFDEFILVQNPNAQEVSVEITYLGTDGVRDVDTYVVGANSRRTIWAAVDLEGRFPRNFRNRTFSARVKSLDPTAPIIAERAIYWGGIFAAGLNPGGTNAAGITQLSDTWRFGEGYTSAGFQTFVLIANPGDAPVTVDTTFFLEDGTTEVDTRTLLPNSRTNIWVNAELGRAGNAPFSILVKARNSGQIAAERAMYWGNLREGHVVAGIPAEANRWAFAEGVEDRVRGVAHDSYFLLNNAGDADAQVTAYFVREDATGFSHSFIVPARSRFTLGTEQFLQLSNQRFSAFFDSTQPIVAERATYWGQGYYGGHASAGVPWTPAFNFAGLQAPAGPAVTSISPAFGPNTGGTDVTIKGRNFARDASVTFGGDLARSLTVVDAETIVARTSATTALGAKAVVVTSRSQSATSPQDFIFEAPPPPPPPPPPPTTGTTARGAPVAIYCESFRSDGVCTRVRTWPFPQDLLGVIGQLATERRDLLLASCVEHGGNNRFMFEAVRRVRQATGSNRWGLNIKRGNQGLSQDVLTYFYGPEGTEMEGDIRVYIFDMISGHCGGNPGPNWEDVTEKTRAGGTIGRWTTAGQSF
jgi:hypothetical protein